MSLTVEVLSSLFFFEECLQLLSSILTNLLQFVRYFLITIYLFL